MARTKDGRFKRGNNPNRIRGRSKARGRGKRQGGR